MEKFVEIGALVAKGVGDEVYEKIYKLDGVEYVILESGRSKDLFSDRQFGEYGERVLAGMRRSVATLSDLGCNVIVDDLLFKPDYLADYAQVLNPDSTWFIGVTCSLDIVREREASRPGRFPGTAVSHFEQVHAHGLPYDLKVDTSRKNPTTVALEIAERLKQAPTTFHSMVADRF